LAVTDWRLRRWRLWFLALSNAPLINPLPPSDSRSETEKIILKDLYISVLSLFKKYYPCGNLKINNLGIFQSVELCILVGKILPISLKLNFTPNTLGCLMRLFVSLSYGNQDKNVFWAFLLDRSIALAYVDQPGSIRRLSSRLIDPHVDPRKHVF